VLLRDPRQLPRIVGSLESRALETPAFRTAFCLTDIEGLRPRRLVYRNWPADAAYLQFASSPTGVPQGSVVSAWLAEARAIERDDCPSLKWVLWSSGKVARNVLRYWMSRLPHTRFSSVYRSSPAATPAATGAEWHTGMA
jgi:hypothetical protein